ncbi:Uncharacterized protein PAT23_p0006 (plasmid) [Pseudomonas aeruginosa]|nr:Uncharacterized protein PAT23_p0006 [Pseudomonas aeruginosa]QEO33951.1 Uncharacterized protein PAT169_p0006 [Pseudomonas aeruginosa]
MAVSPPDRPLKRFSHPGRRLAPPRPAFARYARSGEAEFSATPAAPAASASVMKNSHAISRRCRLGA